MQQRICQRRKSETAKNCNWNRIWIWISAKWAPEEQDKSEDMEHICWPFWPYRRPFSWIIACRFGPKTKSQNLLGFGTASQGRQSYRMDAVRCVRDCYFVSYLFCPESLEEENWFLVPRYRREMSWNSAEAVQKWFLPLHPFVFPDFGTNYV